MTDLVLYCFPGACSRATMIALEEAGARYETRIVNLRQDAQRAADYLSVNPKGKVPVLIIDGVPLTENVAILEYLANAFPDAALLPPTSATLQRAQAVSAIAWLVSTALPAASRVTRPYRVCDLEDAKDRIAAMARDEIRANLAMADQHMSGRDWWVDRWSVADAYLYYIVGLAKTREVETADYPALTAHAARMKARPATKRMEAWEAETMAAVQAA